MADAKRLKTADPEEDAQLLAELLLSREKVQQLVCAELVEDVLACSVAQGVVMYPKPQNKREATAVPLTLTPCPLPAASFRAAETLAPDFHWLMDKVCCDLDFLREALAKTGAMDLICGKLLEVCDQAYNAETGKDPSSDIRLHIMRNDFMFDEQREPALAMVQIELNMMAASFSTHCQDLTEAQRYVLTKFLCRLEPSLSPKRAAAALAQALPKSPAAEKVAEAVALAHEAYESRWQSFGLPRAVLFVSTEDEKNELDHRKLELAFARKGLLALRRSLPCLASATLRPLAAAEGYRTSVKNPVTLIVEGYEVSVAYFRSGYWPQHFTDGAWEARAKIERAEAAKCPSAPAQLAGMKKVQQLLCLPEQLRRFAPPGSAEALAKTFGRQFDPSEDAAKDAVEAAKADPSRWVLKPQVEGSGELFFDEDIPRILGTKSKDELAEFILMERVRPPTTPSAVLDADGNAVVRDAVAELGIFGTFVSDGGRVLRNEAAGHLVRSKGQKTKQGGVFVGNATVDVPLLVHSELFWRSVKSP